MTAKPGSLRQEMPQTAAWIDDLRAAFGAEEINAAIKAGLQGAGTFYAREGGREIGSRPSIDPAKVVSGADLVLGPMALPKKERK